MKNSRNTPILGLQLAVAFVLFAYLGYRYDVAHNSIPWGLLSGIFLAFVYMVYELWKIVKS